MRTVAHAFCLLAIAGTLSAQSVIVPAASANVRGPGGINTLIFSTARTYMIGIPASQLAAIPTGSLINGVSFRSYVGPLNPTPWPPVDTTFSNYDITVGYAIPLATWTLTFQSNFMTTPIAPIMVRTGPMVIEANTFQNNTALPAPQPNPFGDFFWDFQRTFPYIGGDLAIFLTNPGNMSGAYYMDYATSSTVTGVSIAATTYQAAVATSSLALPFAITRVHYGYGAGCPGTGGMVPMLVQSNDVTAGGSVTFGVSNAPANTVAIYAVGASSANVRLPNGCSLLATPTIVFPVALNANGRNSLMATFPPGLSLNANVQVFVIDSGAPGGFAATNGVKLTVSP